MFKKKEPPIPVSSDAILYDKYKKLEFVGLGIVVLGGILSALMVGFEWGMPALMDYKVSRAFMIVGICLIVGGFILFSLFYFKMRKMRENQ